MTDSNVSRRRVLQGIAAGAAATGTAGQALAGEENKIYNVGIRADRDFDVVTDKANRVLHRMDFEDIGKVATVELPEPARKGLERSPAVRFVEPDIPVFALAQSLPWGIDRVDADIAHDNGDTGSGADIAILDTGIDSDHPDLQANIGSGKAFTSCSGSNCNYDWDDDNGHGTHCAGIADAVDNSEGVVGVATEATLHAVKVLAGDGSGTLSDVASGLEYVANQGWDVASMSLGASQGSSTLQDAVQYAYNNGVLVVAAAGNSGPCTDCVGYPAAYSDAMAISSTNQDDNLSSFSSTGDEVELAAPGSNVNSTYNDGGYTELSGTSMATPHVSGAGGLLMATGKSNTEARSALQNNAEDIGLSENESGYGLLDVEAALGGGGDTEPALSVSTDSASSVGTDNATLNGTLNDLGGASSADVYFEWGPSGGSLSNTTSVQTVSSTGSFSADISGLSSGSDYEFRAVADASDGDSATGNTQSFTTDSSGGCFITTATAREERTLDSLRRFRDESMAATPVGRGLVGLYYRISPPIADTLERHPQSKTARACRQLIQRCARLSDAQAATDSTGKSAALGVVLTVLYVVGILVGAGGHAGITARELLDGA